MNRNEFINEYLSQVSKVFPLIEEQRKRKLKRTLLIEVFIILITSIYGYYLFNYDYLNQINSDLAELSLIVFGIFVLVIFLNPVCANDEFRKELKRIYTPKIIKCIGEIKSAKNGNVYLNENEIFSQKELQTCTLFGRFNTIETDDSFVGKYKNTDFKISEVELSLRSNKYYSTIFKGVIISFDINKKIKAKTLISTSNDLAIRNKLPVLLYFLIMMPLFMMIISVFEENIGNIPILLSFFTPLALTTLFFVVLTFFINKVQTKKFNTNNKRIKLEDINFRKRFNVYSEDEVEARYLISPAFMERFLNLTLSFGTKKAKCVFFENKIMFAISTRKNLFEQGNLFKPFSVNEGIKFFKEFTSILDIIEYFKLDEETKL